MTWVIKWRIEWRVSRKKKAGRPELPPGEKASARMGVNFKPSDMERLDRAAKLAGKTRTGSWLAEVGLREAERVIAHGTRKAG